MGDFSLTYLYNCIVFTHHTSCLIIFSPSSLSLFLLFSFFLSFFFSTLPPPLLFHLLFPPPLLLLFLKLLLLLLQQFFLPLSWFDFWAYDFKLLLKMASLSSVRPAPFLTSLHKVDLEPNPMLAWSNTDRSVSGGWTVGHFPSPLIWRSVL